MTVRFTSLEAYRELLASGAVLNQSERIYARLLERPTHYFSRRELAVATGLETASVPRPVLDLIKAGLVVEGEASPCPITQNQVFPVRLATRQSELAL